MSEWLSQTPPHITDPLVTTRIKMKKVDITEFLFDFENPSSEPLIKIYEHFIDLRNLHIGNHDYEVDDLGKLPKKEWYSTLSQLIADYGYEKYLQHLKYSLEKITQLQNGYNKVNRRIKSDERNGKRSYFWDHVDNPNNYKVSLEAPTHYYFYSSDKSRILKGLILSVACVPDPTILRIIEQFAINCPFQVGSVSQAPTGLYVYDVLEVFSMIKYPNSVQHIMNLKSRIKQTWAQKRFDKYITKIAKKEKIELDKVVELGISEYGFDESNCYSQDLENYRFQLRYKQGLKKEISWIDLNENKTQKSIPREVKENHPEALKYLKSHQKEIENQIKTQLQRIEKYYYSDNSWDIEYWLSRYLNHAFIGIISKELYWTLSRDNHSIVTKINAESQIEDLDGKVVNPLEYETVKLWHPLHKVEGTKPKDSSQPFKQWGRETYTVAFLREVEGKILRKDVLSQLCKSRNWTSSNNHNFKLPSTDIKVELTLEDRIDGTRSLSNTSANMIFRGIQFTNKKTSINISEIDEVLLSEILRDVDLFVSKSELVNEEDK